MALLLSSISSALGSGVSATASRSSLMRLTSTQAVAQRNALSMFGKSVSRGAKNNRL